MSEARKINQAVKNYLSQVIGLSVHDTHIVVLATMITGLIRSRSANFDEIGRKSGHPGHSQFLSRQKLIHRFIKNLHVSYESHFLPFIELLLAGLGVTEFRLSIDSSKVGRKCLLLVIGLVYKNRVLPLAWVVYKGSKGHSPVEMQQQLLVQVVALLPQGATVILTGDGEFDGVGVIDWLQGQPTWNYAMRTACNTVIYVDQAAEGHNLTSLTPTAGQEAFLTGVSFTHQQAGPVNIAILWNPKRREHLYLVTSANSLAEARHWYRRRFKIETLFSDSKSRGFGLDRSGIHHPERMGRFLIAVFLGYIWMIYLGALVIINHHLSLVSRTDRFCRSIFQLGRAYLDRIIEEEWEIPISVSLPDPRSFIHLVM